jgi:ATP-dependent Clp protease ATP-binding subunit ClpA
MMHVPFDDLVAAVMASAPDEDSLEQLRSAAVISAALSDTSDALLDHFVDRCRHDGRSWAEIGRALGVSKQAAQKKFVDSSLQRLTPRTRTVMNAAREMAEDQGAGALRLDHLLLAVFTEPETVAARALMALGIEQAALEAAIARRARTRGARLSDAAPVDQALLATALSLGHNYIGTEHIVLACHRDPTSLTARALNELGATAPSVETAVARLLSEARHV